MTIKTEDLIKPFLRKDIPEIAPGDTIKVYQKIKEAPHKSKSSKEKGTKERIQVFEGVVLARKHGKGITSTITVRKMVGSIGVERIFPLHSPVIDKIEVVERGKVRRVKLYYLRERIGKGAKIKKRKEKIAATKTIKDKKE